jgi:UDP-3-O-[3-hydroxymyristoyl] glucosamine N-acyltransferase
MRIAILGWEEGLAGQVSTWVENALGAELLCFVHPFESLPTIDPLIAFDRPAKKFSIPVEGLYRGLPILVGLDWSRQLNDLGVDGAVCCLSNSASREESFLQAANSGIPMLTAIHPSAQILAESEISTGVIIEPNCYVGYRAEVGEGTHVHAGSQVDHHSVLKPYVTVNPGVIIAGNALVGSHSVLNMGALISNRIELGESTVVGAGSTVLESYPLGHVRLIGTPARPG